MYAQSGETADATSPRKFVALAESRFLMSGVESRAGGGFRLAGAFPLCTRRRQQVSAEGAVGVEHPAFHRAQRDARTSRDLGLAEPFVMRQNEELALALRKRGEKSADGPRGELCFAGAVFLVSRSRRPLQLPGLDSNQQHSG